MLEFDGTVTEVLPDGNFRVKLDNDHEILAYTAGKMRKFRIRTGVGDRVIVEMSPYDLVARPHQLPPSRQRHAGAADTAADLRTEAVTSRRPRPLRRHCMERSTTLCATWPGSARPFYLRRASMALRAHSHRKAGTSHEN